MYQSQRKSLREDDTEREDGDSVTQVSRHETDPERGAEADRDAAFGRPAKKPTDRVQRASSGTVPYDPGPDAAGLGERYGLTFNTPGEAERVQRLESEFGSERVRGWAGEGMPVETMGKPRDMEAFRERQEARPAEVPNDVERRNEASVRRSADAAHADGPAGDAGVPDEVRRVVSSPGGSMDESVQREMESKMGGDFSDVKLHTGPEAAAAAESINARAFTVGNHVAFNRGEYDPGSDEGKKVLAHELTHVRQQTGGRVSMLPETDSEHPGAGRTSQGVHVQPKLEVSSPGDPAEKEARSVAREVMKIDDPPRETPHSNYHTLAVYANYAPESVFRAENDSEGTVDFEEGEIVEGRRDVSLSEDEREEVEENIDTFLGRYGTAWGNIHQNLDKALDNFETQHNFEVEMDPEFNEGAVQALIETTSTTIFTAAIRSHPYGGVIDFGSGESPYVA